MALAAGTSAAVGEDSPGRRGFFTSSHYVSQQVSLVEKLPMGPNGKHKAKEMIVLPRNSPPQVPLTVAVSTALLHTQKCQTTELMLQDRVGRGTWL